MTGRETRVASPDRAATFFPPPHAAPDMLTMPTPAVAKMFHAALDDTIIMLGVRTGGRALELDPSV